MDDTPLHIDIRPAKAEELELLQSTFSSKNVMQYHHQRFVVQEKGEGVYLIAWHTDTPIGHFLVRWNGPVNETSHKYPYPTPYLEAGATRTEFRKKGVATRLIQVGEKLVQEKGFTTIGLAVGSTDNPEARRLYEKLGYVDWGQGEFEVGWEYMDEQGNKGRESEVCVYMFKELGK